MDNATPSSPGSRTTLRTRTLSAAELGLLARSLLAEGRSVSFTAGGLSMEPFIRDGDTLVVAPVEATSLRITDVILFTGPAGKPFVHRIVKKGRKDGKPVWITRGDAVMNYTETVSEQQVLGRVIRIQRDAMDHDPGSMLRRLSASLWVLSFPIRYVLGATQARFTRRH